MIMVVVIVVVVAAAAVVVQHVYNLQYQEKQLEYLFLCLSGPIIISYIDRKILIRGTLKDKSIKTNEYI